MIANFYCNVNYNSADLSIITCGPEKYTVHYDDLPENAGLIVARAFSGEQTYGAEFSGLLGVNALTVGVPIYSGDTVVGAVLLHAPASGVNDAVAQGMLTLVIGCAAALLFAGMVAFFLSYRFTCPLSRMKTAALALADGNYEAKTGVSSTDEIGQLAEALECFLSGDYGRIRQLLFILLDNAVKFSPEGGSIEITLAKKEGCIAHGDRSWRGYPSEGFAPYL